MAQTDQHLTQLHTRVASPPHPETFNSTPDTFKRIQQSTGRQASTVDLNLCDLEQHRDHKGRRQHTSAKQPKYLMHADSWPSHRARTGRLGVIDRGETIAVVGSRHSHWWTGLRAVGAVVPTEKVEGGVPPRSPFSGRGLEFHRHFLTPWCSAEERVGFSPCQKMQLRNVQHTPARPSGLRFQLVYDPGRHATFSANDAPRQSAGETAMRHATKLKCGSPNVLHHT